MLIIRRELCIVIFSVFFDVECILLYFDFFKINFFCVVSFNYLEYLIRYVVLFFIYFG